MPIRSPRLVALNVAATFCAILLTGCAASGNTTPSLTGTEIEGSSTAAPSPSNSPESPVPAQLEITAESVTLLDDQGATLWSHAYFDPTELVVESLGAALGTPDVHEWEPGPEDPGGTAYDWNGILVGDPDGPSFESNPPEFFIQVTAAELNGIAITTVDGIQVGDSALDVEANYPDSTGRVTVGDEPERLDAFLGAVEAPPADSGEPRRFTVWIMAADPESTITEFRSPSEASFAN